MDNKQPCGFTYSYSAPAREEVLAIRQKYMSKDEDAMEKLRRLDRSVYSKANCCSIIPGVLGTLIFGTGMSMVLVYGSKLFFAGIITGIAGIALAAAAYPVYAAVLKKEKKRIAPEILRLSEELLK